MATAALDFHFGDRIQNELSAMRVFVAKLAFSCKRGHFDHLFGCAEIFTVVTAHALVLIVLADKRDARRCVIGRIFTPAFDIVTELAAGSLHVFI